MTAPTALVTGGNRGIGLEVVRQLAGLGYRVSLGSRPRTRISPSLGGPGGRPVCDGAAGIVWAATLGDDGPTGGFFRDRRPIAW